MATIYESTDEIMALIKKFTGYVPPDDEPQRANTLAYQIEDILYTYGSRRYNEGRWDCQETHND